MDKLREWCDYNGILLWLKRCHKAKSKSSTCVYTFIYVRIYVYIYTRARAHKVYRLSVAEVIIGDTVYNCFYRKIVSLRVGVLAMAAN